MSTNTQIFLCFIGALVFLVIVLFATKIISFRPRGKNNSRYKPDNLKKINIEEDSDTGGLNLYPETGSESLLSDAGIDVDIGPPVFDEEETKFEQVFAINGKKHFLKGNYDEEYWEEVMIRDLVIQINKELQQSGKPGRAYLLDFLPAQMILLNHEEFERAMASDPGDHEKPMSPQDWYAWMIED